MEGAEGQLNGAITKNDQSWLQGFCRRRAMCAAHKGPVSHRYGPSIILYPILPFIETTAASSELTQPPARIKTKLRTTTRQCMQHTPLGFGAHTPLLCRSGHRTMTISGAVSQWLCTPAISKSTANTSTAWLVIHTYGLVYYDPSFPGVLATTTD